MASLNCVCSGVPFPKRSCRSKVVLHETSSGGIVILVKAYAAKKWVAMIGNDAAWKAGKFNGDAVSGFHQASGGVLYELASPRSSEFEKELDAYGVSAVDAREIWVLADTEKALSDSARAAVATATKGAASTAPPPVPPPTSTVPPPPTAKTTTGWSGRAAKVEVTKADFVAPVPRDDRYWYESEADNRALNDFVSLRRAGHTTNMMVVGPSGFGKTEGIIRLGERLNVPVHILNCQVITTPDKWLGQMQADPSRGTYFEVSDHLRWVTREADECKESEFCILCYDELSRLRPDLGNMTFSLLDGQQGLDVPQAGRRFVMAPENVVFATANIGAAYSGTFALDWALRQRFDSTLERGFPPEEEEIKVLVTATDPAPTEEQAKQMIAVADHTRTLWKAGEIESPISTRHLLAWARYVAGGYSITDAAAYTVIPVYTEDGGVDSDRAKLQHTIEQKVVV